MKFEDIIVMLVIEHLCVICDIDCVMTTILKPKMLKFNLNGRQYLGL